MSELRQRKISNPLKALDAFKEFDGFRKFPEEIEQRSSIGN